MLSKGELDSLLKAEGEDVLEIRLDKCRAGDVYRAKNRLGTIFLIEVTVPISRRANVFRFNSKKAGDENYSCNNYHFCEPIKSGESAVLGYEYTLNLVELKKVRSG